MRIIADSNVLLSATISEGPPFEIVNMVLNGTLVIVFSRETWGELGDVLMTRTPFDRIAKEVRGAYLGHIAERATWASPVPQPVKCRDPNDQMFLDLARPGDVDYLSTGDDALLSLRAIGRPRFEHRDSPSRNRKDQDSNTETVSG